MHAIVKRLLSRVVAAIFVLSVVPAVAFGQAKPAQAKKPLCAFKIEKILGREIHAALKMRVPQSLFVQLVGERLTMLVFERDSKRKATAVVGVRDGKVIWFKAKDVDVKEGIIVIDCEREGKKKAAFAGPLVAGKSILFGKEDFSEKLSEAAEGEALAFIPEESVRAGVLPGAVPADIEGVLREVEKKRAPTREPKVFEPRDPMEQIGVDIYRHGESLPEPKQPSGGGGEPGGGPPPEIP